MSPRVVQIAPLLVAILLHMWASAAYPVDAVLLALALVSIPLGGRAPLGATATRVLSTVAFVAGAAAGWSHPPDIGYGPGTLPRVASLVAVGALAAAVARTYARASAHASTTSADRPQSPFVLATLAVAASGATRLGAPYVLLATSYLALTLLALRMRDGSRAQAAHLDGRRRAGVVLVASFAALLAFGFARAVPPINRAVQRAFERVIAGRDVVGFGGSAWLGAMRDVIRSEEEVLRIAPRSDAVPVDYLRGAVYDEYSPGGFWSATPSAQRSRLVPVTRELGRDSLVRVRRISGTASHYFVPLGAREVRAPYGTVEVDALGAVFTAGASRANDYEYALGERAELAPAPPTEADLRVPEAERATLEGLARAWADAGATPEARLGAIRDHLLAGYAYSLDFKREAEDPLLDFLLVNKLGYCTYFASAFALVARASGVPTRMVTGYRVGEWSPVAREYVVRDRNAHAWVEAWEGGAWKTYDATPMGELPQDTRHLAGFWTLASDTLARIEDGATYAVTHVTLAQLFSLLAALLAAWLAVRAFQRRAAKASGDRADERLDPPLPCFERLAASLAARGVMRRPSEPLERFASRLGDAQLPEAARLVERYAALRYGGLGERGALEADVEHFLRTAAT